MSGGEDWAPGDLALCVNSEPRAYARKPLRSGAIYTVSNVHVCAGVGLELVGVKSVALYGFDASRFRKIRPHNPDAEDAETIRLLNGAPVREPVA